MRHIVILPVCREQSPTKQPRNRVAMIMRPSPSLGECYMTLAKRWCLLKAPWRASGFPCVRGTAAQSCPSDAAPRWIVALFARPRSSAGDVPYPAPRRSSSFNMPNMAIASGSKLGVMELNSERYCCRKNNVAITAFLTHTVDVRIDV